MALEHGTSLMTGLYVITHGTGSVDLACCDTRLAVMSHCKHLMKAYLCCTPPANPSPIASVRALVAHHESNWAL